MREPESLQPLRQEGALAGLSTALRDDAVRLRGHASTRRFYRVRSVGGATAVLVVYPADMTQGPERYVATSAWFRSAGIRVPRVAEAGRRSLLVEDGGDVLLDAVHEEPARTRLYAQAIDVLEKLQRHGRRAPAANPGWALDAERLRRELEHTEEHALRGWLKASTGRAERAAGYDRIVREVSALPLVACHRDFHARNLLAVADRLLVLDFQDVMSGPLLYDLASLLWDNYCDVPEALARRLAASFWNRCGCQLPISAAAAVPSRPLGLPPAARQAFCLVGLQRSLKALGTFGYQVSRVGNADYARYAPRTWRHARAALVHLGWQDLLEALGPFDALLPPPA